MTNFTNGPAQGKTLQLRRNPMPLFLRVVVGDAGRTIDALDQLDDQPRASELLYAYRKASDDGAVHINSRDAKTGKHTGGFFACSTYALVDPQPLDAEMRTTAAWAEWTHAERAREVAREQEQEQERLEQRAQAQEQEQEHTDAEKFH